MQLILDGRGYVSSVMSAYQQQGPKVLVRKVQSIKNDHGKLRHVVLNSKFSYEKDTVIFIMAITFVGSGCALRKICLLPQK